MDKLNNQYEISYHQAVLLLILYRIMVGFTHLPAASILPGNQDIWITILFSTFYTILLCLPLLYLSNKFNSLNLIEYIEKIMGKTIGKIIGIFYVFFFLYATILLISIFVEILDAAIFPETPTWVTASMMLITSIYIAYKGFVAVARLGEFIIPFILVMILLFIILGYKNYDFTVLLPILKDSKFKDINIGAIDIGLRYFNILILTMITPNLKDKKDLNKIFFRSLIYSMVIASIIVIVVHSTLGIEYAKHVNFPFFTVTRMVDFGETIQGFDSLYLTSWIVGNIIKISGYLYFTTVALGQITNIDNRKYIIPISVVILIIVLLLKDNKPILAVKQPTQNIITIMAAIFIFILPLIILIVYLFRRKKL